MKDGGIYGGLIRASPQMNVNSFTFAYLESTITVNVCQNRSANSNKLKYNILFVLHFIYLLFKYLLHFSKSSNTLF